MDIHGNYSDFQLNCQLLLASRYITRVGSHRKHPFPSNGYPSIVDRVTSGMCLPSRCLALDLCLTIFSYENKDVILTLSSRHGDHEEEYNLLGCSARIHGVAKYYRILRKNVRLMKMSA
jgi:hypothetical protein